MKQLVIISILMMTLAQQSYCQTDSVHGIHFIEGLSWQEILQKAKVENKYIFVDCYASWCGPCKWMDENVYSNDTLGDFMNKRFIAVKVQMDTSKNDELDVQQWYSTAHEIARKYRIGAYPSFLFLSPTGVLVHKGIGATDDVQGFINLAKTAMDPEQQFYTLLSQYQNGERNSGRMIVLANAAKKLGEDSISSSIASDYIHYLGGTSDEQLWIKENITFIGNYRRLLHYKDPIFQRYLKARKKIDSIMDSHGYADGLIHFLVYRDDVNPKVNEGIKDSTEPNWHAMEKTIERKYGRGFAHNVVKGRVEYYQARKLWKSYAKYLVQQVKETNPRNWPAGSGTVFNLDNASFEVFKYSTDKKELEEALSWINIAISMESYPEWRAAELDTKANLLYKLGEKEEALLLEKQSGGLAPNDKEIQGNYAKMKDGLPTWPTW